MTVYYGPGAAGSGIAELMGYFNGIKVPGFISVESLVTKVVGNVLAVSAGLAVGKEGPLAHIGAIVGQAMLYLPVKGYEQFHNESSKREASAAGAAAGVSAAFGAPIGGTLLAYEASRPNTFWSFSLMWRVFFSSCISTYTLNVLTSAYDGESLTFLNAGLIQFGQYDENAFSLIDFPFFIVLGAAGGSIGAFFNFANTAVNKVRKEYLTTNSSKVWETIALTALTATVVFYTPDVLMNTCTPTEV